MLFTVVTRVGQRRMTTYIFGDYFEEVREKCVVMYGEKLISVAWEPEKDNKFKEKFSQLNQEKI